MFQILNLFKGYKSINKIYRMERILKESSDTV